MSSLLILDEPLTIHEPRMAANGGPTFMSKTPLRRVMKFVVVFGRNAG
jgi:hypothetical protein